MEDRRQCLERTRPRKRVFTCRHFVQHAAKGKDIGAIIDGLAPHLLGRHVAHRAEYRAGLRSVGHRG
jgi:hypothetical protein